MKYLAAFWLTASTAFAQTQIRPRVVLMVDTSGSMTLELGSGNDTGADGSTSYTDGLGLTRDSSTPGFAYGEGFSNPAATCVNPTVFRGTDSRLFAAKSAVNSVLNASGEIDWGLMRYAGDYCAISAAAPTQRACGGGCQAGGTCSGGVCHCASDNNCRNNEFCVGGICVTDANLCNNGMYGMSDSRGTGVCRDHYALPGTYTGSCGTTANCLQPEYCDNATPCQAGATCSRNACTCNNNNQCVSGHLCSLGLCVSNNNQCTACQSLLTCSTAADCNGGACNAIPGSSAKACACSGNAQCPTATGYTCVSNLCTYSRGCRSSGGILEVDPKLTGSNAKMFPWVDGVEDYSGAAGAFETLSGDISTAVNVANPELRSKGNTPLAGSARTASNWYGAIRDYTINTGAHPDCLGGAQNDPNPLCDSKLRCRPYVLVQLTDGVDTCEGGGATFTDGPPAAARGFVNATVDGARVLNKVYVIGLSVTIASDKTELNNIASAGGTQAARFANTAADIEAALADIVSSSVLVERCNNADDDCNGACDEPFPDVGVSGAGCSNPRAAKTCSNGELAGTHCAATGTFECSMDGLSEVCNAPTCTGDPEDMANPSYAICPRLETAHGCNGQDDDCNGVVDDCTPFVAGSCCTSVMCPACNPTGVPQTELCNGCDDDCDGVIDNHLMDPAVGVTGGPPCIPLQPGHDQLPCMPGVTICVNGQVVCDGEMLPEPNQCDGISRDCTGMINSNGNCPEQTKCFMGICAVPCGPGEFPCPGGFVCKEPEHLCVPDACVKLNCAPGTICKVADDGTATCSDPCAQVVCPSGFACKAGVCKENTCRTMGCPVGQICSGNPPGCVADPCAGVVCPAGQFCDGTGNCKHPCANGCAADQVCSDGNCQSDPCVNHDCSASQTCLASSAGAACVDNLCTAGCNAGAVCCGGQCRPDPCAALNCSGLRCLIDHACGASCVRSSDDFVVGAGGGLCEMGGGHGGGWAALLLLLLLLVRRRRAV
jgi:hypothetical protein